MSGTTLTLCAPLGRVCPEGNESRSKTQAVPLFASSIARLLALGSNSQICRALRKADFKVTNRRDR